MNGMCSGEIISISSGGLSIFCLDLKSRLLLSRCDQLLSGIVRFVRWEESNENGHLVTMNSMVPFLTACPNSAGDMEVNLMVRWRIVLFCGWGYCLRLECGRE